MLKETRQEQGCLRGCLMSFLFGGILGGVAGFWISGHYLGAGSKETGFYLLLRWGYAGLGFLAGTLVWGTGNWLYVRFFVKGEEEETI